MNTNSKREVESKYYPMIRSEQSEPYTLQPRTEFRLSYQDEWNSVVETNELGFRGEVKKGGVTFLGDSFTVSIRVDLEQSFLKRFEDETGIPVSNVAVGGWGTIEERDAIKKYFDDYDPETVVLVLYLQNDVWENLKRFHDQPQRYLKTADSPLVALPRGRRLLEAAFRREPLYDYMWRVGLLKPFQEFSVYKSEYGRRMSEAWEITKELILDVKAFVEGNGADFALVSMPSPWQTRTEWREEWRNLSERSPPCKGYMMDELDTDFEKPERIIREFAQEHDVQLVSFLEETRSSDEDLYFESVDHWNERGHEFVARHLVDALDV